MKDYEVTIELTDRNPDTAERVMDRIMAQNEEAVGELEAHIDGGVVIAIVTADSEEDARTVGTRLANAVKRLTKATVTEVAEA